MDEKPVKAGHKAIFLAELEYSEQCLKTVLASERDFWTTDMENMTVCRRAD